MKQQRESEPRQVHRCDQHERRLSFGRVKAGRCKNITRTGNPVLVHLCDFVYETVWSATLLLRLFDDGRVAALFGLEH